LAKRYSKKGPPLLTFLGTTYPTGSGCVATLLADFTPGHSVGLAPYLQGKKGITEWFENKSYENSRQVRKVLTVLHFLFSYIVFFPVLAIYIFYSILIRPYLRHE